MSNTSPPPTMAYTPNHDSDLTSELTLDEKKLTVASLVVQIPQHETDCTSPSPSPSSSSLSASTDSMNPSSILHTPTSPSAVGSVRPNVTFAPLPRVAPRKRRSPMPLGMAARGQLARRRQQCTGGGLWTAEEVEEQQRRYQEQGRGHVRYVEEGDVEGDEVEDPFLVLGRMVKGAGRSIWRRVSKGRERYREEMTEEGVMVEEIIAEDVVDADEKMAVDETQTIVEGAFEFRWMKQEVDSL